MNRAILTMGLNHTTAPIKVREGVACTRDELVRKLPQLVSRNSPLTESLILSTCNRTEVYAVTDDPPRAVEYLRDFFRARQAFAADADCLYTHTHRDAATHLLTVACGLDSMVVGEFEILGQVREAFEIAAQEKTVGPILTALCQAAIHTGKRARSETAIGRGAASVAYAAVQLVRQIIGELRGRCVLVIGTGEMGKRAAKNLRAEGVGALIVANRTYERAVELARDLGGSAIRFEEIERGLRDADIVISATGAPHLVLHASTLARAMAERPHRALCLIDIAVPRDVDPAAAQIPNAHLFDLDHLQTVTRENIAERQKEIARVQTIVAEQVEEFWQWYQARHAASVIAQMRERAAAIRAAELAKALRRLSHLQLNERDRNVIAALTAGIANKLLAAPITQLKTRSQNSDGQIYLDAARELFGLKEDEHPDIPATL